MIQTSRGPKKAHENHLVILVERGALLSQGREVWSSEGSAGWEVRTTMELGGDFQVSHSWTVCESSGIDIFIRFLPLSYILWFNNKN